MIALVSSIQVSSIQVSSIQVLSAQVLSVQVSLIALLFVFNIMGLIKNKYYKIIPYIMCGISLTNLLFYNTMCFNTMCFSIICVVLSTLFAVVAHIGRKLPRLLNLLNIFIYTMFIAIASDSLWLFYVAIELIGILSTVFVVMESKEKCHTVYIYNKFASSVFLIGCCCSQTQFGVWCLLIGCLCKSAQLPFSYWIISATKAHILASILIHCATVLGVGILFICKFHTIFDNYPQMYDCMSVIGLSTAIIMPLVALFETNIKKIIACLSISSAGIMFLCCGLQKFNLSILYFICHAYFKSILFIIFANVIEFYQTKNINKYFNLPKITLAIAILSCLNVFPLCGSFAMEPINNSFKSYNTLYFGYIIENIVTTVVLVKLFIQCTRKSSEVNTLQVSNLSVNNLQVSNLLANNFVILSILSIPICWFSSIKLGIDVNLTFSVSLISICIIYLLFYNQKQFTINLPHALIRTYHKLLIVCKCIDIYRYVDILNKNIEKFYSYLFYYFPIRLSKIVATFDNRSLHVQICCIVISIVGLLALYILF